MTNLKLVDSSAPAVDHLALVEARRVEMLVECDDKINALRDRVVSLKNEAREKRHAARKLASPIAHGGEGNHHGAVELSLQVDALAEQARQLEQVDIPALLAERENIRIGVHPGIATMGRNAMARIAADRQAKQQALDDAYDKAHEEFARHLLRLATPKTFELARAVEIASRAVKRTPNWAVRFLLTENEPGAA